MTETGNWIRFVIVVAMGWACFLAVVAVHRAEEKELKRRAAMRRETDRSAEVAEREQAAWDRWNRRL